LTALLVLPIGWVYSITKSREVYDRSLVKTLLILGMVVCGMMMLIQDHFARALALVAAVSAVQFRTTLKDPNDAVYVLVSIAIGMGTGLGVFRVASLFTIVMSLAFLTLWRFRVGEQPAGDAGFVVGRDEETHKRKKKKKRPKRGTGDATENPEAPPRTPAVAGSPAELGEQGRPGDFER
jgi:hypothetical protein